MPRIWQLIDSSAIGGIERHIEMLARGLIKVGIDCEVVLFANYGHNPWLDQLTAAEVPFRVLRGSITDLKNAMKSFRPSLVHTHGYKAGILGRPVARLTRTPVISTFHSGERGQFPVSWYQTIDEMSAFLAPAISVSEPIRNKLPVRSELVHNFVNMPNVATDPTKSGLRIGFVGRFSEEKGPDHFCSLCTMLNLAPEFENVEWHTYGDGVMHGDLAERYQDQIFFNGLATDMGPVWPTLDLLLMTSRAEGLPLATLEAMSHGIPVIAPELGALPDVIEHGKTGWLFEPNNLDDAADCLMEWVKLTADQRQTMFDANRTRIAQKFSVQSRLKTMLDLYKKSGLKIAA